MIAARLLGVKISAMFNASCCFGIELKAELRPVAMIALLAIAERGHYSAPHR